VWKALTGFGWYWAWRKQKKTGPFLLLLVAVAFVVLTFIISRSTVVKASDSSLSFYRVWSNTFLLGIVPLVAVFCGVGLLRDEVENNTLVYLWTRPCGRVTPFVFKWLLSAAVLAVSGALCLQLLYWGSMLARPQVNPLADYAVTLWDTQALVFAVVSYLALGLMFGLAGKRAVHAAMVYVVVIDSLTILLPGELRKLSLKILSVALSSSGKSARTGADYSAFFGQQPITESEAWVAGVAIIIVCWVVINVGLRRMEIGRERVAGTA